MTDTMAFSVKTDNFSPEEQSKNCLLALIGLGIGEISGSLLIGKVQDKLGNVVTTYVCVLLTVIGGTSLTAFTMVYEFKMWLAVIMTFTWGVQDGACNTLISCILGF